MNSGFLTGYPICWKYFFLHQSAFSLVTVVPGVCHKQASKKKMPQRTSVFRKQSVRVMEGICVAFVLRIKIQSQNYRYYLSVVEPLVQRELGATNQQMMLLF